MSVTAVTNDEAPQILASRGIEWELGTIEIENIDLVRSLSWNAREDGTGLNDYWVETYAQAFRNHEEFPPIICMRSSATSEKFLVLSGHHRVAAAQKAKVASLPAYMVEPLSDSNRLYVTTEANRKVGYGLSEAQRIESALRFVRQGESASAAARIVGLPPKIMIEKVAQMRADDRVQKLSSSWSRMSPETRKRLDSIQSDELLKKTADLVTAASLGRGEVNKLVRDINKGQTDVIRDDVIASMWEVYRPRIDTGGKDRPMTKAQGGYIGLMRASISRLANPVGYDKLDEILLSSRKGFEQDVVAAQVYLTEAVKRLAERNQAIADVTNGASDGEEG